MSCNECILFEKKLAFHTAPALLGIKAANLVSLRKSDFDIAAHTDRFNARAASKGLKIKILCECGHKSLILLYSEKILSRQLADPERRNILKSYGYSEDMTTEECLDRLAGRISGEDKFPHEIGIFLGYPVEDVVGFIKNKGDNYKLCGYWKVYGDEKQAQRTFDNYTKCRNFLCNKLNQGTDIYKALKIN